MSYDPFKECYRVTSIDSRRKYMSVSEGDFDESGARLTLSNLETNTPFEMSGQTVFVRTSYSDLADDSFNVEYEVSLDAGETWWVAVEAAYTRADP